MFCISKDTHTARAEDQITTAAVYNPSGIAPFFVAAAMLPYHKKCKAKIRLKITELDCTSDLSLYILPYPWCTFFFFPENEERIKTRKKDKKPN